MCLYSRQSLSLKKTEERQGAMFACCCCCSVVVFFHWQISTLSYLVSNSIYKKVFNQ